MDQQTKQKPKKRHGIKPKDVSSKNPRKEVENDDAVEDNELKPPTEEEIRESLKPENNLNIETVRQKKQKKFQEKVCQEKRDAELTEIAKNVEYLKLWHDNKTKWKFEKLRQISIQKNAFIEEKVPESVWPFALQYLSGTKGASREQLLKNAEEVIRSIDEGLSCLNEAKKPVYNRAREIIQILQ